MVELVLRTLRASDEWMDRNIAVLSRGYKRESKGFQQVMPEGGASMFGDEPLQIKKKFPWATVAVDKDRVEGCEFLQHPEALASEETPRRCRRQKQTAPLPHKETKARKTSAVPLFLPRRPGPLKPVM